MKELTEQNAIDIVYGSALLGTGGGGNLKTGLECIRDCYRSGKTIKLAELDELPDDSFVATPYGCGAPKLLTKDEDKKYANLPHLDYPAALLAFHSLEEYMGKKFFAVASSELGGESTAEAMYVSSHLGIPLMNADAAGRAVPDLQYSTYFVKNKPIFPMAVATEFGEVVILKNVVDDFRAEAIARSIAIASNDLVGVTDHPMSGKDYKESVIPEAITFAMKVGETMRLAKSENKNGFMVAQSVADKFNGEVVFRGHISEAPWESRNGYNYGEIHIKGCDGFNGDKYRICFKNENIISFRNGKIDIIAPDLICMVNADGIPVNTPNFDTDMELNVLALPAPSIWTSKEGLEVFNLNYFGFDVEYRPFKNRT